MIIRKTVKKIVTVSLSVCSAFLTVSAQKDMPDTTGMFRNEVINGHKVYLTSIPAPQYPDDIADFLAGNLRYPKNLQDWKGAAYATFVVDSLGNVLNVTVLKKSPSDPDIPKAVTAEFIDLITNGMARWRPGRVDGHPVYVRVFLQGVLFEPGM
jgi:hypothetical protein